MNSVKVAVLVVVILGWYTVVALAISPTSEEMTLAKEWVVANLGPETKALPFYFRYDGKRRGARWSKGLLEKWQIERSSQKLDEHRTQTTITYTDPKTSLEVRCVLVEYNDFPTVEWTVYFKNNGTVDTPILEDIQVLDLDIQRPQGREFLLHHQVGSLAQKYDYQPLQLPLALESDEYTFSGSGGRSSNAYMPYFNLQWRDGGMILAVGWPGQWVVGFKRFGTRELRIRVGQQLTHFKLYPGEEVRTPLVVLQFWKDDRIRAQNIWRRWMIKHNLPRREGKVPEPFLDAGSWLQLRGMVGANEENQKYFIDRYLEEQIKIDYWWMDAGWYFLLGKGNTWVSTGTWEVDTNRFPHGLRAIADHAHSKGVKIILWFEPERVSRGTWLYENHEEWLLGSGEHKLLNLGNPQAWNWLVEHVDNLMRKEGIDMYRHDCNIFPLNYWRESDATDRQGIAEIRYISNLLRYYDELRNRHGQMVIDNCSGGGRRNDLEMMRRSIPLTRSDHMYNATDNQCQTYGLAFWLPFYAVNVKDINDYAFHSSLSHVLNLRYDMRRKDLDYDHLRQQIGEWRKLVKYFYGDFYPLTTYSVEEDVWMAWQFDRPDLGEGMLQAFRRSESINDSFRFRLKGLESTTKYELSDGETQEKTISTGRELGDQGLKIQLIRQPDSVIITYRKVK